MNLIRAILDSLQPLSYNRPSTCSQKAENPLAKKGRANKPAPEKTDPAPRIQHPTSEQVRKALAASFIGWIFPGAGHWYLGQRGRATVFLTLVILLLVLGICMDGQMYRAKRDQPLTVLAAFASMGSGPAHFILQQSNWTSKGRGDTRSPYFEFGNTFILVAGLLNMLIILDAYDVGAGYKP
jgi:hypothetical protein